MAGAAPGAKPAPFLKPLDLIDRGVLLAESALSLVTVAFMLFAAVSESAYRIIGPWPVAGRIAVWTALCWLIAWLSFGPSRRRELGIMVPAGLALGVAIEFLARAVLPLASDVLMHGTIWAAFLGASFATRGRKHLAIDALSRLIPDRGRRVLVGVSASLGAFVAFSLATGIYGCLIEASHQASEQLAQNARNGVNSAVDRSFEFQFVIPGGFTLIGLRLLLHAFHEFVAGFAGYRTPDAPVKALTGYRAPADDASGEAIGAVAAAHEGATIEEPKVPAAIERATAAEVAVALVALVALILGTMGSTIVKPVAGVALAAGLSLVVPLYLRQRRTGSMAPPHPEPEPVVKGEPAHFAMALACVVGILAVMRFVAAPHIASIPMSVGVAFFAVMALIGAPLFSFLGGMGLFLFVKFFLNDPDTAHHANAFANSVEDVLGNHFARMSVLATIPLFTLAGYVMSESRMPQRLVRVSRALLGWLPGGLAVVCVFASAFFTIFSGASGITIVAVGGLLVPALLRDQYPEKFSLGLVTTGGALGITVPPCLPLIVYGIVAGLQEPAPGQERLELQKFMVVGLLPGMVAIGLMIAYCVVIGMVAKVPRSKFDAGEAGRALWEAKWELILPAFLLFGLAKGIFNPSQAAAFTAAYVVLIEVFVYRDLTVRGDLPRIVPESMVLVGAIFVKLCAATVLVGYFVQAQIADRLFEWLTCGAPAEAYLHAHSDSIGTCREAVDALARMHQGAGGLIDSKLSFLIALNVFLLLIGMLMDIFSAIVVVVPLIAGIALHFNINPYHLGIVFLMNLEIGYLMPPMGLNLFIAGFRFNRPVPDLYRMVLPFIGLFVTALMIVTYVPQLTLAALPKDEHAVVAAPSMGPAETLPTTPTATADAGAEGDGASPAGGSCDLPNDNESFDEFQRRCAGGGDGDTAAPSAAPSAPAERPADCDLPRDNESFDEFQRRCNAATGGVPATDDAGANADAATGG